MKFSSIAVAALIACAGCKQAPKPTATAAAPPPAPRNTVVGESVSGACATASSSLRA